MQPLNGISLLRRFGRAARRKLNDFRSEQAWRRAGCPVPPPPSFKRALLKEQARQNGLNVFVETGTLYGQTLEAMCGVCDKLHSIELSLELYKAAVAHFADQPKVRLWHGDSGEVLPSVLETVDRPALFWLDGHYSGPGTARGALDSPICSELEHISEQPIKGHAPHSGGRCAEIYWIWWIPLLGKTLQLCRRARVPAFAGVV